MKGILNIENFININNPNFFLRKGPTAPNIILLIIIGFAFIMLASLLPVELQPLPSYIGVIFFIAGLLFGFWKMFRYFDKMSKRY